MLGVYKEAEPIREFWKLLSKDNGRRSFTGIELISTPVRFIYASEETIIPLKETAMKNVSSRKSTEGIMAHAPFGCHNSVRFSGDDMLLCV